MKAVIQRVLSAEVTADGILSGKIGKGYTVLLGVRKGDTEEDAAFLAKKVAELRIMEDENGKMNKSLTDVGGEILAVSNFTLYGNAMKSRRPDFAEAESFARSEELYNCFVDALRERIKTETGVFSAYMRINAVNDGPVTIILETEEK